MGSASQKQSKLMRFVTTPFRALGRAGNFYVRCVVGCSTRTSCATKKNYTTAAVPRSLSAGSSRSNESEDLRELIRAASARTLGENIGGDAPAMVLKRLPKSCSVAMARIDEESSCDLGEDDDRSVKMKPEQHTRSKSYAVSKTSVNQL